MLSAENQKIIILPTFEDSESTKKTIQDLINLQEDYRFVIVEDGSIKNSISLESLEILNADIDLVVLHRNYGNQRAIALGLQHVYTNYPNTTVVLMDSDGEDKPEFVPVLFQRLEEGQVDVVVASRTTRESGAVFKVLYFFYKIIFRITTGKKMNFGNFSALKPGAINHLIHKPEIWVHIGSSILSSNLRINNIPLPRGKRHFGKSRTNTNSLIQHGIRSINVFADRVIVRFIGLISTLLASMSIITIIHLIHKILNSDKLENIFLPPNWFYAWGLSCIFFSILFMGGCNRNGLTDINFEYKNAVDKTILLRKKD